MAGATDHRQAQRPAAADARSGAVGFRARSQRAGPAGLRSGRGRADRCACLAELVRWLPGRYGRGGHRDRNQPCAGGHVASRHLPVENPLTPGLVARVQFAIAAGVWHTNSRDDRADYYRLARRLLELQVLGVVSDRKAGPVPTRRPLAFREGSFCLCGGHRTAVIGRRSSDGGPKTSDPPLTTRKKRTAAMLDDQFHVYDTTLRDGAQQEGLNLTVADKLVIARHLDR